MATPKTKKPKKSVKMVSPHNPLPSNPRLPVHNSVNIPLPPMFQPLMAHQFIFKSPHLSSWIVSSLVMPKMTFENGNITTLSQMEVKIHATIVPDFMTDLETGFGLGKKPSEVWLLDPVGTVIQKYQFEAQLSHFEIGELSYDNKSGTLTVMVYFDVDKMTTKR